MGLSDTAFRNEIHRLAEDAFYRHLISGYGNSEYEDKYQIVYQGALVGKFSYFWLITQ